MSSKHHDTLTESSGITLDVPVRVLFDRGLWFTFCEVAGVSDWAVNEGRMDMNDTVTVTEEEARTIGLL